MLGNLVLIGDNYNRCVYLQFVVSFSVSWPCTHAELSLHVSVVSRNGVIYS